MAVGGDEREGKSRTSRPKISDQLREKESSKSARGGGDVADGALHSRACEEKVRERARREDGQRGGGRSQREPVIRSGSTRPAKRGACSSGREGAKQMH